MRRLEPQTAALKSDPVTPSPSAQILPPGRPTSLEEQPIIDYLLTIVFLYSQVTLTSLHVSQEECERAAEHARQVTSGTQAVESARCTKVPVPRTMLWR